MEQLGPYRILDEIARGGMGVVYRAVDTRSGQHVALKVLLDLTDLVLVERFRREVTLQRELIHPNLVRVLDLNVQPPMPYAVFELVEGGTLKDKVEREGPLPWAAAVALLCEVAAGASAVHERGLLHRDIKPENVLLAEGGAKLADFGLVKDFEQQTLTQTGATLGTPRYLAPEQIGGAAPTWSPATDVYGLGATLCFALTGAPPFCGSSVINALRAVLEDPPPSLRGRVGSIPLWLDLLCQRALAKHARDRPPTAIAFRVALREGAQPAKARRALALRVGLGVMGLTATSGVAWTAVRSTHSVRDTPSVVELEPTGENEHLVAGLAFLRDKDYAHAVSRLTAALADEPTNARAYRARGIAYLKRGELLKSLADLDRAVELVPAEPDAFVHRAGAKILLKRLPGALEDCNRALMLDPHNVGALRHRGAVRRECGDLEAALRDFDALLEQVPEDTSVLSAREDLASEVGELRDELLRLDGKLELNPKHLESLWLRSRARRDLGRFQEALSDLNAVVAVGARSMDVFLERGELLAKLGHTVAALSDLDAALVLAREKEEADPILQARREEFLALLDTLPEASAQDYAASEAAYEQGLEHFRAQDFENALASYGESLRLNPRSAHAYCGRGTVLRGLERLSEAHADYDMALALQPDNYRALMNRAYARVGLGREAEALLDCDRAVLLSPQDSRLHATHGHLLEETAHLEAAIEAYTRALKVNPEFADALHDRGRAKLLQEDYPAALEDCEQALRLGPDNPRYLELRGRVFVELGSYDEALEDFKRALESGGRSEVRARLEQRIEAVQALTNGAR